MIRMCVIFTGTHYFNVPIFNLERDKEGVSRWYWRGIFLAESMKDLGKARRKIVEANLPFLEACGDRFDQGKKSKFILHENGSCLFCEEEYERALKNLEIASVEISPIENSK